MRPPRVYLDTNAIIAFVEEQHKSLRSIFEMSEKGMCHLVTSQITLAEVLVRPMKEKQDWLIALYEELLHEDRLLDVRPIDMPILRESAKLRVALNGKLPDSIHVATALSEKCSVLISSDKRLRVPPGLRCISVDDPNIDKLEGWPHV
ncbi:hypothetical protein Sa4125_02060 [Aureimonas sp. SA4125]|uniref:type II toxin-antitoxin system VapC family toxin n=1 Tax=Aureimonas sp. SA4125 TaxID=2826993 RepID=UPI001CC48381|nr:type II toxin-antitoxin system VapC family toxin [Aureimonas sp. SA4125]BDA82664.1 hypothetical protein Sa4125_02060 [Aureimonas sp. SA4125]